MSAASALSGDTYRTRSRRSAGTAGATASRSIAARNAASVLPEPVGAITSASWPAPMACQAPSWAAVGAAKALSNQARVSGEKPARDPPAVPPDRFAAMRVPPDASTPNAHGSRRHRHPRRRGGRAGAQELPDAS
jgi:hypothetical protein